MAHLLEQHVRKVPGARKVNKPTYAQFLVGKVERFDQRNTVFSRVMWDKEYQQELAKVVPRASRQPPLEAIEQRAMRQGAIYVDDAVGSLHANYAGFSGHVRGVGGLYDWDDPVSPEQYPVSDPAAMSERVKQVARFYGADLVGITEINPLWVYSHYFDRETGAYGKLEIPYKYAIVMGIEMDWAEISTSPNWGASAATALAYSKMAELSSKLAKYIRMLGYPAVPSGNDTAQSIPLAIDAGLGELGRLGLLLTPEFGPRQRLCKVLTNLPLVPDQPIDFGIQKFCETCFVCAKNCPARAIRFEERTTEPTSISNRTGILRWPVNVTKCYLFWRENGTDCSNCVRACPWSRPKRGWL
jgi:ferredoxin